MLQTSTLQGCVSRSNDQSNILFFFSDSISSSHLSRSQLRQPPRKMNMCFPNVFNGILLNTIFFWGEQIQQMSLLQERSGLESLHLRKSQKLRPGSHASSAPPAASVARTTATHQIPLFFFLSLVANGYRFELGKRFWNGSGSFRKGNRCRNVLKWKLILTSSGF